SPNGVRIELAEFPPESLHRQAMELSAVIRRYSRNSQIAKAQTSRFNERDFRRDSPPINDLQRNAHCCPLLDEMALDESPQRTECKNRSRKSRAVSAKSDASFWKVES